MGLSSYNGFSPQQRDAVQRYVTAEWDAGRLPRPSICTACGQTEGAIHGHHEDYGRPDSYVPLCITCHLVLHMRFQLPATWLAYLEHIANGWVAPALEQRTAFGVLRGRGGIFGGAFDGGTWRAAPGPGPGYLDTLPLERRDLTRL